MIRSVVLVVAIAVAGSAAAQGAQRPDPKDPKAPVPSTTYRSAFEDYRPYADQELAPWRRANEEVGAAGGHTGMFKPRQGSGQDAPAKPPAEGHGGHK
jgi:hypothetical protein